MCEAVKLQRENKYQGPEVGVCLAHGGGQCDWNRLCVCGGGRVVEGERSEM